MKQIGQSSFGGGVWNSSSSEGYSSLSPPFPELEGTDAVTETARVELMGGWLSSWANDLAERSNSSSSEGNFHTRSSSSGARRSAAPSALDGAAAPAVARVEPTSNDRAATAPRARVPADAPADGAPPPAEREPEEPAVERVFGVFFFPRGMMIKVAGERKIDAMIDSNAIDELSRKMPD